MVRDSCPLSAWTSKKDMKRRVAERAEAGSRDKDWENIIWKLRIQISIFAIKLKKRKKVLQKI